MKSIFYQGPLLVLLLVAKDVASQRDCHEKDTCLYGMGMKAGECPMPDGLGQMRCCKEVNAFGDVEKKMINLHCVLARGNTGGLCTCLNNDARIT